MIPLENMILFIQCTNDELHRIRRHKCDGIFEMAIPKEFNSSNEKKLGSITIK